MEGSTMLSMSKSTISKSPFSSSQTVNVITRPATSLVLPSSKRSKQRLDFMDSTNEKHGQIIVVILW